MAVKEYGARDLRNHTSTVLRAVEDGDTVYLTNRGMRVAEIRPIDHDRPIDVLMEKARHISSGDTGALDELLASKDDDIAAQAAKGTMWP